MTDKQPLSQIDGNAQAASAPQLDPFNTNPKPAPAFARESEQEKALFSKVKDQETTGKQKGFYVSPSDNILSPASAKLNAFKEKRLSKSLKPRTLFARPTETMPFSTDAAPSRSETQGHQSDT